MFNKRVLIVLFIVSVLIVLFIVSVMMGSFTVTGDVRRNPMNNNMLGDQLKSLLVLQDMRISELGRLAGVDLPNTPVFESLEAKKLIMTLNNLSRNELAAINSWLKPGSKDPHFDIVNATSLNLENMVGNPLIVSVFDVSGADADLKITTGTVTDLSLQDDSLPAYEIYEDAVPVVTFDGEKILLSVPYKKLIVYGTVVWAANGTGQRTAYINYYLKSDDSLVTRKFLHQFNATDSGNSIFPFVYPIFDMDPDLYYMRFSVHHSKGSDLQLVGYNITFTLVQ